MIMSFFVFFTYINYHKLPHTWLRLRNQKQFGKIYVSNSKHKTLCPQKQTYKNIRVYPHIRVTVTWPLKFHDCPVGGSTMMPQMHMVSFSFLTPASLATWSLIIPMSK